MSKNMVMCLTIMVLLGSFWDACIHLPELHHWGWMKNLFAARAQVLGACLWTEFVSGRVSPQLLALRLSSHILCLYVSWGFLHGQQLKRRVEGKETFLKKCWQNIDIHWHVIISASNTAVLACQGGISFQQHKRAQGQNPWVDDIIVKW